jgi:hypothetical protein
MTPRRSEVNVVIPSAAVPGPVITQVSRARLARDALRFGFLGAMLLYTFLPVALGARADALHLRSAWPGPWAGAIAGFFSVLGGILYSAGPAWRSTLQPPHALVDAQFYATALGAIAVFAALMMSPTVDGSVHPSDSGRSLITVGGGLLMASTALFVLNAWLAFRSHRRVRAPAGT